VLETPKFIQGLFPFQGKGLAVPGPLQSEIAYKVPEDKRSQLIYFRAGNSASELIYFVIRRNGSPMRYFPVGAKSGIHISLAVVEDLHPGTLVDVLVAAPEGLSGQALLDIGFMEF
jgi:hypothetical protein